MGGSMGLGLFKNHSSLSLASCRKYGCAYCHQSIRDEGCALGGGHEGAAAGRGDGMEAKKRSFSMGRTHATQRFSSRWRRARPC